MGESCLVDPLESGLQRAVGNDDLFAGALAYPGAGPDPPAVSYDNSDEIVHGNRFRTPRLQAIWSAAGTQPCRPEAHCNT